MRLKMVKEITPEIIKQEYAKAGLKIDKIVATKLGDGWFVYHENASPKKKYVYERKLIKEENGKATFERIKKPVIIKSDFVSNEEDAYDLLEMYIAEAKVRAKNQ